MRRFWRGDAGMMPQLATNLLGSSDIFEQNGRQPWASINYVASHDGFTLADLVSYQERHNDLNGEGNRDGHPVNYSDNYGVEGHTDDPAILALRRRQHRNMLAGCGVDRLRRLVADPEAVGQSRSRCFGLLLAGDAGQFLNPQGQVENDVTLLLLFGGFRIASKKMSRS